MKFRVASLAIFLAIAVGGGIWWITRPAPEAPAKPAGAAKPAAPAPKPVAVAVAAPKVEAPKMAPAQAPVATPAKPAAPAASGQGVVAELNATINDMVDILQTGDFLAFMDRFMPPDQQNQIPPEMRTQIAQQMAQNPRMQQQMQMMAEALQSLKDQTPTINDAGDRATYQMTPPAGMVPPGVDAPATIPVTFVKVDGKWYADQGM